MDGCHLKKCNAFEESRQITEQLRECCYKSTDWEFEKLICRMKNSIKLQFIWNILQCYFVSYGCCLVASVSCRTGKDVKNVLHENCSQLIKSPRMDDTIHCQNIKSQVNVSELSRWILVKYRLIIEKSDGRNFFYTWVNILWHLNSSLGKWNFSESRFETLLSFFLIGYYTLPSCLCL